MSDAIEGEATFGERFLAEWKSLGGPMSAWTYAEIQELRACDREGFAQALRRHSALVEYRALQRIRRVESPEQLARETLARLQAQAATGASMWILLAMIG